MSTPEAPTPKDVVGYIETDLLPVVDEIYSIYEELVVGGPNVETLEICGPVATAMAHCLAHKFKIPVSADENKYPRVEIDYEFDIENGGTPIAHRAVNFWLNMDSLIHFDPSLNRQYVDTVEPTIIEGSPQEIGERWQHHGLVSQFNLPHVPQIKQQFLSLQKDER